jgi:hypothetical protein
VDALVEDGEFADLLSAMTQAGVAIPPDKIRAILAAVDRALTAQFQNPPLDLALAIIATVAGNQLASMIMQVQRAAPVSDAGRDGRVKAVTTFVTRLVERSVTERVIAAGMDKSAAVELTKINARLL